MRTRPFCLPLLPVLGFLGCASPEWNLDDDDATADDDTNADDDTVTDDDTTLSSSLQGRISLNVLSMAQWDEGNSPTVSAGFAAEAPPEPVEYSAFQILQSGEEEPCSYALVPVGTENTASEWEDLLDAGTLTLNVTDLREFVEEQGEDGDYFVSLKDIATFSDKEWSISFTGAEGGFPAFSLEPGPPFPPRFEIHTPLVGFEPAMVERGEGLSLGWAGVGEGTVEVQLVSPTWTLFQDTVEEDTHLVICTMVDDGEFVVPEEMLASFPEGEDIALTLRRRWIAESPVGSDHLVQVWQTYTDGGLIEIQ